ncbi:MAG: hypothetical protein INF43_01535 [Alphaproteobacteria bacterium]|jgi:hypothetical protein|nr:hypothetical protein [Alphaproteobacteria bacterium]
MRTIHTLSIATLLALGAMSTAASAAVTLEMQQPRAGATPPRTSQAAIPPENPACRGMRNNNPHFTRLGCRTRAGAMRTR